MFIDTHCHLNFQAFDQDLSEVIARAVEKGIDKILIPGAKLDSSQKAVEISEKYPTCFAAAGIHPHHAKETAIEGTEGVISALEKLTGSGRVVAVGEIGLDNHGYKNYPPVSPEDAKIQQQLFVSQLELAIKKKLPVIIHCRQAQSKTLEIISSYCRRYEIRGVFHCFEGSNEYLSKILDLGFYVGFDGNITYPENDNLRSNVKFAPLERILLETDAPYLTPVPYRNKRNEPSLITLTAAAVASIKMIKDERVVNRSAENAVCLFELKNIP